MMLMANDIKMSNPSFVCAALPSSSSTHFTLDRVRTGLQRQQSAAPNVLRGHQEKQMREAMLERGRRTYHDTLLLAAKEAVAKGLKEKDAEVRRAVRHAGQLQNRLSEVLIEKLAMEAKAMEQENAIAALQAELRAREAEGSGESSDAESCYVDPERTRARFRGLAGICRECQERPATVVVLPCKHLCLCEECNEEVAPVPCHVCGCIRSGCVQVFLD